MIFELKKEMLKKADEKAGFSGEIYILSLPSGAIKVHINDFKLIYSGYFTSECEIFKKRKIPTIQFMGGGFYGTLFCGDAIITMNEMGYDLTNDDDIKKAKKQDREKIVAAYETLVKEKPELFDASKIDLNKLEDEGNITEVDHSSRKETSKSLIIKYGYHEPDSNNYPYDEGNYFIHEDQEHILIPTGDQIDQIISSLIAGNEGTHFSLWHQSRDRVLSFFDDLNLENSDFSVSDGDSQSKTPLTKKEFTEAIHFFLSELNNIVWEDLKELPDDCDLSKEIKKILQEKKKRDEARKQEYQDELERISQLKASIKKLLEEKAVKMPASDIDAYLKYQNVDKIKTICEEMYQDGEISYAGNGRYFILTEEKKKPKKALAPKSEAVDVKAELRKYKEMLDEGLITQEMYDAKAKELLGL